MTVRFQINSQVLVLPSPRLHDTRELRQNVTRHFDMLGQPHTFNDPLTAVILVLNFDAVPRQTSLKARAFFIAAAGQTIQYVDQDSRVWSGIVTNRPGFTSQGICSDALTVEFEGN